MSLLFSVVICCALLGYGDAQFFFNQGFNNFFSPPQQFQRPFFNLFQPQTTTAPTTTTTEFIPDPDKEVGNFPMPNPANWPVGPDWNDPRNNNDQQLGWGGNGQVGGTTSTRAPITTTLASTTTAPTVTPSTSLPVLVTKKPIPGPTKKQPTKKEFIAKCTVVQT
ncbi:unnamed protein product [Caenorhabditis sp. 36 PRJEB53466]|nr:unnamed protein product [Caenorhabditis sp. 36 PRJEB53466]